MLAHNGPLSAVGLCLPLYWKLSNYQGQRVSGDRGFHNNFTLPLHRADRVPRPASLQHRFTVHNEVVKVTMPFKLRPQCEGSPCCLSRRAGQHLGVGGRDSRSRFTWDHVNTTPHTRSTSPSGSSRTTTALLPRRKVHHYPFVTTREHHTQYNPHYTHHNPTTSYHHVWAGQHRLRIRPAVRP